MRKNVEISKIQIKREISTLLGRYRITNTMLENELADLVIEVLQDLWTVINKKEK